MFLCENGRSVAQAAREWFDIFISSKEQWSNDKTQLSQISIYSFSDLGVLSNLIGSLSWSNWALFTPYRVNNACSKQNKMAGVNSRFVSISEISKIQENAVPGNSIKATKNVVEITEWVYTI